MLTKTNYVTLTLNYHLNSAAVAALEGDTYEQNRVEELLPTALRDAEIPFDGLMVDTTTSTIAMQVMVPDDVPSDDITRLVQIGSELIPYVTRVEKGLLGYDVSMHSPIFPDSTLDGDLLEHFEPFGLTRVTNPKEAYATWSAIIRYNGDDPTVTIYEVQYPTLYADGSALACNEEERVRVRFTEVQHPEGDDTVEVTGFTPEFISTIIMTSEPVDSEVRGFANQQANLYMDAVLEGTPHTAELVTVGLAAMISFTMAASMITNAGNKRELVAIPAKMEAFAVMTGHSAS